MTHGTKTAPLRTAIPAAAVAALLLAGCSTGHIGESWQCPLAEGGRCDSVAAADPAVPDAGASDGAVLREPLWRVRGAETDMTPARGLGQAASPPCDAECGDGFDPFAWLARLFAAKADDGDGRSAGRSAPESAAAAAQPREPMPGGEPAVPAEPDSPLPAETGSMQDGPAEPGTAGDLRTGEVVARIWIAPFVDADGVYREASHVRVVLEPAGWRLP